MRAFRHVVACALLLSIACHRVAHPSARQSSAANSSPQAGWTRQASIWIRGNDGPSPGENLQVGQTTRLIAEVVIGEGPPGAGPRGMVQALPNTQLRWRSSRPDIASVDSVGYLTARRPGQAYIIATAHALTAEAQLAEGIVDSMRVQVKSENAALASLRFTTVSAPATSDAYYTCATSREGQVLCWGNSIGQESILGLPSDSVEEFARFSSPDGSPFTSVATGFRTVCGLTTRGAAFCWGSNEWGQLGDGSLDKQHSVITPVADGHRFQKLRMGRERACAISDAERLYCWGSGMNGALGAASRERCAYQIGLEREDIDTVYAPCTRKPIAILPNARFRDVAVGDDHACALDVEGALYCWGYVYNIDFHESRPVRIGENVRLVALTSGSRHICGLDVTGTAYCWGRNWRGQLGQPAPQAGSRDLMRVAGPVRFLTLTAGDDHTCGLSVDGRAYCWGKDGDRQLGIGASRLDDPGTAVPSPVAGNLRFTSISAGAGHTCAISTKGAMFCWGSSLAVRPGLNVLKEEPEPFHIAGPHEK